MARPCRSFRLTCCAPDTLKNAKNDNPGDRKKNDHGGEQTTSHAMFPAQGALNLRRVCDNLYFCFLTTLLDLFCS